MHRVIAIAVLALLSVGQAAATRLDPGGISKDDDDRVPNSGIAGSDIVSTITASDSNLFQSIGFESLPIGTLAPFYVRNGTVDIAVVGGSAGSDTPIVEAVEGLRNSVLLVPNSVQFEFSGPIQVLRLRIDNSVGIMSQTDYVTLLDEQSRMICSEPIMPTTDDENNEYITIESDQPFVSAILGTQGNSLYVLGLDYVPSSEGKL